MTYNQFPQLFQFDKSNPSITPSSQQQSSNSQSRAANMDDYDEDIFELNMEEPNYITTATTTTTERLRQSSNTNNRTREQSRDLDASLTSPLLTPQNYSRNNSVASSSLDSVFSQDETSTPLSYKYENEDNEGDDADGEADDYLMYECVICKQRMNGNLSQKHNCTANLYRDHGNGTAANISNDDLIIKNNNELIQNNYRKWLFKMTPSIPY
ncbi:uncharacterized protein LODBEIA_P23980 [Lodderomyces beijingensis]|uniref:Uncharacterized protein n=1 Tax=Lodderomyces beijingensis TaxID=1775926 RepID=A0ABP0ZJ57_9ASCO